MKECDVILTPVPQADGKIKLRPAVVLREMPGAYRDVLVCGVSTQLHLCIDGFDELISSEDKDFVLSGFLAQSLIRLGFLAVLPRRSIVGTIGSVSAERHRRLLERLSNYLVSKQRS